MLSDGYYQCFRLNGTLKFLAGLIRGDTFLLIIALDYALHVTTKSLNYYSSTLQMIFRFFPKQILTLR